MNLEMLKNALPLHAKDIKLNLNMVMNDADSDLDPRQIASIALACAYITQHPDVITALSTHASEHLSLPEITATKAAATIMAMNNVYYRFTHLMQDKSYSSMPAKLRMNVLANPGMDSVMFELSCLAISAINGCGMCMNAHAAALEKAGVSKLGIQSAVRIAAVVNAAGCAVRLD